MFSTIYKSQDTKVSKTQREVYSVSDAERTKIRTIVDAFKVNFLAILSNLGAKCLKSLLLLSRSTIPGISSLCSRRFLSAYSPVNDLFF